MEHAWTPLDEHGEAAAAEGDALGQLLDRAHFAAPRDLPGLVREVAAAAGLDDVVLYLVDYGERTLIPLPGAGVPEREPLSVDQTFGGRAYRSIEILASEEDGGTRVWAPLLDGITRAGVLEALVPALDEHHARLCRRLASLVAFLVSAKRVHSDTFPLARRTEALSLAAEMQWDLLPPLAVSDGRVAIGGMLEPSYRIAGDTFDYALNEETAHVAIIDAMGHGFEAAVMAAVAVKVYRFCRRTGQGLEETYARIDEALQGQFGGDRFATAQLLQLDTASGKVRWLNAGHPAPQLIRGNQVVGPLDCAPSLPLGLGGEVEEVGEEDLEPGDRILLLSDGVLEARSEDGEFFGERLLPEFVSRELAGELPSAEMLRRLAHATVTHHGGALEDDATTVVVEWAGRQGS